MGKMKKHAIAYVTLVALCVFMLVALNGCASKTGQNESGVATGEATATAEAK